MRTIRVGLHDKSKHLDDHNNTIDLQHIGNDIEKRF